MAPFSPSFLLKRNQITYLLAGLQPQHVHVHVVNHAALLVDLLAQILELGPLHVVPGQPNRLHPLEPLLVGVGGEPLPQPVLELQIEHEAVVLAQVAVPNAAILFQHDASLGFGKLVRRFEVEEQIATQPAPLFETYCGLEKSEAKERFVNYNVAIMTIYFFFFQSYVRLVG